MKAWTAYAWLIAIYVVGWGQGISAALTYLGGAWSAGAHITQAKALHDVAADLAATAVLLGLLVAACRHFRISRSDLGCSMPRTAVEWHRDAVGVALSLLGPGVVELAKTGGYPRTASGGWGDLREAVGSLIAGPTEEIALLAFVAILLRQVARRPWWEVATTAALLRWAFHIYYAGPHPQFLEVARTLLIVVWPLALLAWFWSSRRLLGLLVAHSAWDVMQAGAGTGWADVTRDAFYVLIVSAFAFFSVRTVIAVHLHEQRTGVSGKVKPIIRIFALGDA